MNFCIKNRSLSLKVWLLVACCILFFWGFTAGATSPTSHHTAHDLFGLSMGLSLDRVENQFGGVPSPFSQANSYLLTTPPRPNTAFPMVTVIATEKTGICAISGSFASKSGDETIVRMMFQLVLEMSQRYGPPTTSAEGEVTWDKLPPNSQAISRIAILSDQLPEDISLVSLVYFLDNYSRCETASSLLRNE